MLSNLDGRPFVPIVNAPHDAFVLEPGAPCFGRRVDAPFSGGREFSDSSFGDEVGDGLLECAPGGERPYGGSLSLDRDLRGGICEGLGEHVAAMRSELDGEESGQSG